MYLEGNEAMFYQIKPLWEALNQHHLTLSQNFKQYYKDMTFHKRKADLLREAVTDEIHVDIVIIKDTGEKIGYCITSLNQEKIGK